MVHDYISLIFVSLRECGITLTRADRNRKHFVSLMLFASRGEKKSELDLAFENVKLKNGFYRCLKSL